MKKLLVGITLLGVGVMAMGCDKKEPVDGSYDFIIYESDKTNNDLSDNKVVAKYTIEYSNCKTVTDTLIRKGSAYFFSEESNDYIIMKNSQYGLSYNEGYFEAFSECASGDQIDVSWSFSTVNGEMAPNGIGQTSLEGLKEYGFVINGWKDMSFE